MVKKIEIFDIALADHLAVRKLAAILIEGHRRGRGSVVAVGHPPNRDLDDIIKHLENVCLEACSLVTDHKCGFSLKPILMQIRRIGRLFQANEPVALGTKLAQYWWQGSVDFDL